jgi:hypothetical protein
MTTMRWASWVELLHILLQCFKIKKSTAVGSDELDIAFRQTVVGARWTCNELERPIRRDISRQRPVGYLVDAIFAHL